ncbi:MAG: type II toxin-antitoxin system HicA family toxin [Chloroflexi bacterium]|nr:type II toxin-antitoxin system HicA family toxin [Chloroflexota bacterium]
MSRLPRVTASEFIRAIQRDGWFYVRQRGGHRYFAHGVKPGLVVVPVHVGKTLKVGLVHRLLDDAGLTPEELEKLL